MKTIYLTIILSLICHLGWSQASLEITLRDSLQNPVIFHPLLIINTSIGYEKEVQTDMNGKVQLDGLSTSGSYTVTSIATQLYQSQRIEGIALISDKVKSVSMAIGDQVNFLDEITISVGNFQTINSVDAEVASELRKEEIKKLPIEGRDITRALYRLPNITQATGFYPEAPNVAINGANPIYTNYQIDGIDNNENFLGGQRFAMPVGFTENITALTNNFSAEHGLTSNGVINITSKSGTNETSGEIFYITRPGSVIDASSPYAQRDLSGNQVKDGFQRHQVGIGLGGPIVKNKTFYLLNVEHTKDIKDNLLNVPQLGINETIRGANNFTYISTKIDQHWSNKLRSSIRINKGIINLERQGGGLEGGVTFPSAGNEQDRNSINVALKNTYLSDHFTYESNYLYGRFGWNYADPVDDDSPNVTIFDPSGITMAVIGHPGFVFEEIENTHVIQQKLIFYKNEHRIKTGLQVKSSNFELFGGGNPNGSYTVQLNDTQLNQLNSSGVGSALMASDIPQDVRVLQYGVELRPNSFEKRQNIVSLYIEDQWSVNSKLNINAGLRYDYDNLSKGGSTKGDLNNIAPRLSMNYKLSDKSSIRAGYGIYYDKILYALYSDALQFNSNSLDYKEQLKQLQKLGILDADADLNLITNEGNLVASDPNASFLSGPSAEELQDQRSNIFQNELRILNPNGYDNPYSQQFMLGYQHKVNDHTVLYIDAIHNRSNNLFRIRNLNAPELYSIDPNNVIVRSTQETDLTRPVPIQSDATGNFAVINGNTVRGIARNVVMTESAGRSNYYAMNVTVNKDRLSDKFAYRLMYTLSFLENNTEGINFRAMDANNYEAEWGPSINDRTHLFNGVMTYHPTNNISITLASLLQSGQPINRIPDANIYTTTDLNGDGRSFGDAYVGNSDRSPGEQRNSDRLPWSTTFDMSLIYTIPIGNNRNIEVGAQVFNLLNAENLSGYSNNATQSNQIQTGPANSGVLVRRNAAPPRQFQFSLRYLF